MSNEPIFCEKCGSSLNDNVQFCTNCGTEVNEEQIKRTTKNEFLSKYYGKKILDHIEDIISERIGDTARLRSIYYLLDSKKELDDVNFEYLKECSDIYNTRVKSNEIIPKQKSNTSEKEKLSTKYKITGIIVLLVIAVGIAIGVNNSNYINEKSDYEIESEKDEEIRKAIIKTVQEYKGKDGKGETLLDALVVLINVSYRNENIFDNPSTEIGWSTFEGSSFLGDDGSVKRGIYNVMFFVKTYREDTQFVWHYDTQTKEIFAGNERARSVLNIVDSFG